MKIETVYPPEVAAMRERLFELMEYEARHAADPLERERRVEPIVNEIMKTEIHGRIQATLEPDEYSFLNVS